MLSMKLWNKFVSAKSPEMCWPLARGSRKVAKGETFAEKDVGGDESGRSMNWKWKCKKVCQSILTSENSSSCYIWIFLPQITGFPDWWKCHSSWFLTLTVLSAFQLNPTGRVRQLYSYLRFSSPSSPETKRKGRSETYFFTSSSYSRAEHWRYNCKIYGKDGKIVDVWKCSGFADMCW